MTAAGRAPLRILSAAFAASALLVVLQTVVFKLLPYDSSASGTVAVALRAGFIVADGLVMVGLLALRPRLGPSRALPLLAAVLALGSVISGVLGLTASALGSSARTASSLAEVLGLAEPMGALGIALLAALGVAALPRPLGPRVRSRVSGAVTAVAAVVALAIAFRLGRLAVPGPRSLVMAWASWALEVLRPALVAWVAVVVTRQRGDAASALAQPGHAPYRAAGEGAEAAAARPQAAFGKAASALRFYQIAFAVRLATSVFTPILALLVSAVIANDSMLPLATVPLLSLGAGALVAAAHLRLVGLAQFASARGLVVAAVLASGFGLLVDVAVLLYGISGYISGPYFGKQTLMLGVGVGWPSVSLLSGAALLLVASALGRVGEALEYEPVVARARWTQALAIFTGALQAGVVLVVVGSGTARHSAGQLLVLLMVLGAAGATIALPIVHLILIVTVRGALLARAPATARSLSRTSHLQAE